MIFQDSDDFGLKISEFSRRSPKRALQWLGTARKLKISVFAKRALSWAKTWFFVIFVRVASREIRKNPRNHVFSLISESVLKHLKPRFVSKGVKFRRFWPDSDDFGSKFMNFRVAHQNVLYSGSGPFWSWKSVFLQSVDYGEQNRDFSWFL